MQTATSRPGGRHILLIHQLFVQGHEAGGTRHLELARHLVRHGDRVTVVASPLSYLTGRRHGASEGSEPGITLIRTWTWVPDSAGFLGRLLSFLSFTVSSSWAAMRVRDVDVVWGTSPPLFQALGALLVARLRGLPFVLEVRDLWPDFAVELGVLRNRWLIALARRAERFVYLHADRVVVNSPGFVPHLQRCGADPARVALIPNGVEVATFDPRARGEDFRREIGAGDEDVVVLYSGAHGIPNDLDVLLDAAALLSDRQEIRWVLVGDGREKTRLGDRARQMGLGNVTFVAAQPKERMPEVVAAADVCLAILKAIPMFDTTYPNKVFDYMAAGRPTVLAIDGVIRAVVEAAGGGAYVAPGRPDALAAAVARYADDPELRRAHGAAARSYVATHFRREDHAETLRGVLAQAGRR